MRKTTTNARFIKASSILVGDHIRVVETWQDAEIVKIGTVAKRERSTYGTEYITNGGIVLYTDTRDGLSKAKITLLNRPVNVQSMRTDDMEALF